MISAEQRQALSEAADWLARRQASDDEPQSYRQWQAWRQHSAVNAWAWQRVELLQAQLGGVDGQMAGRVLTRAGGARVDRRQLLGLLLLGVGGSALAWSGYRQAPVWLADQRTASGERRRLELPDGSQLTLNSDSAVNLGFDASQRGLVLLAGEIMIETAADPRPFFVTTGQARLQALGTRFVVRQHLGITQLSVLEHAVAVQPQLAGQAVRIEAGQGMRCNSREVLEQHKLALGEGEWANGRLVIDGWPLERVLAELGRYRPGYLGCAPQVAGLRVSGSFPLDDPEQALVALARALPIEVRRHTRYWVRVVARP
ncbi:Protein FecR [Pseudomonas reidholzensis]|uniref:Protein FecR n=1 Tax=Pseudomonas reidholzensis TaxID=1785162 RepID=A0A383RR11_9PSED|nr:FecR domain-containing protein [Pseudomonas reidholzensis]SYX88891.1 Protein FecR [Pseudomonas reidholzensis]